MLNFIGTGSAFNTEFGNNSAYFKSGNTLFLIDCGGTTFDRIVKMNLLDDITHVFILITHLHPDHVGSLGDLVFYLHFMKRIKATLVHPEPKKLRQLLNLMGVSKEYYLDIAGELIVEANSYGKNTERIQVRYMETHHVKEIRSFAFIINIGKMTIYYGGDANTFPEWVKLLVRNNDVQLYIDVCGINYPGNVHLHYDKLKDAVALEDRSKVTCMHFDTQIDILQIEEDGFKVATSKMF